MNTRNILPCISHAHYMKMTRDEHAGYLGLDYLATFQHIDGIGFNQIWIGIEYFLMNFYATICSARV